MDDKGKKFILYFLYLVLILIVFASGVLIIPVQRKYDKHRKEHLALKRFMEQKQTECLQLNKDVHDLENSPRAIEKVAREKFGLCKKGELILRYPKDKRTKTKK